MPVKRLAGFAAMLLTPLGASAQGSDPLLRLTDAITVCDLVGPIELEEYAGPFLEACLVASRTLFEAAGAMTIADQERLGLGFVDVIRAAPPAETFDALPPTIDLLGNIFGTMTYRQCWPGGTPPTLEECAAAIRIIAIAAQALPPEAAGTAAIDICLGSQGRAEWQPAIFAVIDELVARTARGGDPVMRAPIDAIAELRARCGIVTTTRVR
ncbi:MAG: hypothetical protein KIS68_12280 [Bauldia sp.]|nr:hypothetical protein [Bauldia sp.]